MYRMTNRRKVRKFRKMRFWRQRLQNLSKPRLCVYRSNSHIQAQVIDDTSGRVLASASSFEGEMKKLGLSGKKIASEVGSLVAKRALKTGVTAVVFDRNGFTYHGRVQVLADAAREAGLSF